MCAYTRRCSSAPRKLRHAQLFARLASAVRHKLSHTGSRLLVTQLKVTCCGFKLMAQLPGYAAQSHCARSCAAQACVSGGVRAASRGSCFRKAAATHIGAYPNAMAANVSAALLPNCGTPIRLLPSAHRLGQRLDFGHVGQELDVVGGGHKDPVRVCNGSVHDPHAAQVVQREAPPQRDVLF